jgi:ATP-dependent Clp protease ATP-binding subunit ClpC
VSDETGMSYEDMKNRIMSDLKKVFRPEFLNRIDEVIVFHKLAKEEIKQIIDLMINRVRTQVAEHHLQLDLSEEAKELLIDKGWDPSMGARPLRRAIQRYVEDPLADEVLKQGQMASGSTVMVDRDQAGDEEHPLKLTIIPPTTPPKSKDDEEEPPKVGVTADKGEDDEGSDEPSPDEPSGDGKSGK